MNVADLLEGKRICVCAGSGGVGKTTTAAAIALGMAQSGRRVAVVTIDPARRLANALGLERLGNEPRRVEPELLAAAGLDAGGELWAMMLDAKRTFDELIELLAPDERTRDEVLSNRIYKELSSAVAGSQEFTAIAKLYELDRSGQFDMLVLDTPPSRNALDFLEAPDRLTQFFEGRALQVLLRPAGLGMRIVGRGSGLVFSILGRVTGVDLLDELSVFFRALGGMVEGFKQRARRVAALLADPGTTFLLVTSPEREPLDEALYFRSKLAAAKLPFGAAIVNKVHHDHLGATDPGAIAERLETELEPALAARVEQTLREYHELARRDLANIAWLEGQLDGEPVILVPQLDDDVHDLPSLARITRYLFASAAEREQMLADVVA